MRPLASTTLTCRICRHSEERSKKTRFRRIIFEATLIIIVIVATIVTIMTIIMIAAVITLIVIAPYHITVIIFLTITTPLPS